MTVFEDIKNGLEQAIEYEEIDNLLDAAYWLYEAWAYISGTHLLRLLASKD